MTPPESNILAVTFVQKYHETTKGSSLEALEPPKAASTIILATSISSAKIHKG